MRSRGIHHAPNFQKPDILSLRASNSVGQPEVSIAYPHRGVSALLLPNTFRPAPHTRIQARGYHPANGHRRAASDVAPANSLQFLTESRTQPLLHVIRAPFLEEPQGLHLRYDATQSALDAKFEVAWAQAAVQGLYQSQNATRRKVVFVGDIIQGEWANEPATTTLKTFLLNVEIGSSEFELVVWRIPGGIDSGDRLRQVCYSNSHIAVIGYAIDDRGSLKNLQEMVCAMNK
ncbi:Rho GTPase [Lithohypha guttulata]|uniref:Rho GTPase n=1 Tax=Lithohypha guttulata TaxID=1690604 RepID=A0ABR0KN03_9EURO|nr:Rho GTPase [Lithohypha guttulata]